jgi:hypothetical protein
MPSGSRQLLGGGPHTHRLHSEKVYRGSRKRLRRITWRGNTTPEFWIFVVFMLILLFVIVPWMIRHPADDHHFHKPESREDRPR